MSTPYLVTALIAGMAALWLWALVVYWSEDTCLGVQHAQAQPNGRQHAYGSFVETEVYATSAGYRAPTKSTTSKP